MGSDSDINPLYTSRTFAQMPNQKNKTMEEMAEEQPAPSKPKDPKEIVLTKNSDKSIFNSLDADNIKDSASCLSEIIGNLEEKKTGRVGKYASIVGTGITLYDCGNSLEQAYEAYEKNDNKTFIKKLQNAGESALDFGTNFISDPVVGTVVNVTVKSAHRTAFQTYNEMKETISDDTNNKEKTMNVAGSINDVNRKFLDNAFDIIGDSEKSIQHNIWGDNISKATDVVIDFDTNMKKAGNNLVHGHVDEAKQNLKNAVGENIYNEARNIYHKTGEAIENVEKQVIATTKSVTNIIGQKGAQKVVTKTIHAVAKKQSCTICSQNNRKGAGWQNFSIRSTKSL